MRTSSKQLKIIAAVYILILVGIICLADIKGTQFLLDFTGGVPYGDKIGHFFLTGFFSLLLNLALNRRKFDEIMLGSLIVFGLVTIEELSQIFIDGRTFDLGDLVFDYAGIFIFGLMARSIKGKFVTN